MTWGRQRERTPKPQTMCSFWHKLKYSVGSALDRLGVGVQMLGKLRVTVPTQYYISVSLDIGVFEDWGLTFDQASQSPWI